MLDYLKMDKATLLEEKEKLQAKYDEFAKKGLKLDMSRGKPGPEQLDLSMGLLSVTDYIDEDGVDTRNYGDLAGIGEARRMFAEWFGTTAEETFVGGSASLELMYFSIQMGWRHGFVDGVAPWQKTEKPKFLCPAPGYDRHFRITESFGFELISVPMLPTGPDMDAVEKLVADEDVKGIWIVPVYSNPDGYTCSEETAKRLANMKTAAKDFRIFWDNAYGLHHLTDDGDKGPDILAECKKAGNDDRVLMFMSTSKITFAGAGVGAMSASKNNIKRFAEFMFPVIISFDKMSQLRHARFLKSVGVTQHMKKQAAILKPKFDIVDETLKTQLGVLGDAVRWTKPKGGYFISLYTMDGCAKRIVDLCKQVGMVLTGAGAAFPYGKDPNDNHIRIAPTYPPMEELKIAAELLCVATCIASVDKLIAEKG